MNAEFISDSSIPDGTHLQPGTKFRKSWLLRNTGSYPWTRHTRVRTVREKKFANKFLTLTLEDVLRSYWGLGLTKRSLIHCSTRVVLIVRTLSFLFSAVYKMTFCGKDLTTLNVMLVLFHLSFFTCDVAGRGSWDLFQYQIRRHIEKRNYSGVFQLYLLWGNIPTRRPEVTVPHLAPEEEGVVSVELLAPEEPGWCCSLRWRF